MAVIENELKSTAEDWAAMSTADLIETRIRNGPYSVAEIEVARRLLVAQEVNTEALTQSKLSADNAADRLQKATVVLVALTAVLVVLTVVLLFKG